MTFRKEPFPETAILEFVMKHGKIDEYLEPIIFDNRDTTYLIGYFSVEKAKEDLPTLNFEGKRYLPIRMKLYKDRNQTEFYICILSGVYGYFKTIAARNLTAFFQNEFRLEIEYNVRNMPEIHIYGAWFNPDE